MHGFNVYPFFGKKPANRSLEFQHHLAVQSLLSAIKAGVQCLALGMPGGVLFQWGGLRFRPAGMHAAFTESCSHIAALTRGAKTFLS